MNRRKARITEADADEMFRGDILDRVPGTSIASPSDSSIRGTPPQPDESDESKPIKVSLYLRPEVINALDAVIMRMRLENGNSPRRTHLIREAIQQWLQTQEA